MAGRLAACLFRSSISFRLLLSSCLYPLQPFVWTNRCCSCTNQNPTRVICSLRVFKAKRRKKHLTRLPTWVVSDTSINLTWQLSLPLLPTLIDLHAPQIYIKILLRFYPFLVFPKMLTTLRTDEWMSVSFELKWHKRTNAFWTQT